ncbi:hypothetical protein EZS27_025495 [termite gut metagenome]|uniref:Uncharacterized protein n=1 Tax=termite gut metagenome TaxID=433724 RepID=A0A5J4QVH8_9ZZZZ
MDIINNTCLWLERFNRLVKLQLKIRLESFIGEIKINCAGEIPDIEDFKIAIEQTLHSAKYSDSFIDTVNQIFFLSWANSDLIVEFNLSNHRAYNEFCQLSPPIRELDKLSLDVFNFIGDAVFEQPDRLFHYKGFEVAKAEFPEYRYKEDKYILWPLYHLVCSLVESYHKQEIIDLRNQLSYLDKSEVNAFIKQQQDKRLEQIWESVKGFCDRNLVFEYLESESRTGKEYLVYTILSNFMEKTNVDGYIRYVEFDYIKYHSRFQWSFEKNIPEDYKDLFALPEFNRLVYLLCNIFYVKEIEREKLTDLTPIETVTKLLEDNRRLEPVNDNYLLDITLLGRIYTEFNGELWIDIPVRNFLNMFTTSIHFEETFKVLQKERFHYLLKKIWLNGEHRHYFNTEKEWIEPFLNHYNLSVSGYWNQTVKNGKQVKHRTFISSVDKILPLTELS